MQLTVAREWCTQLRFILHFFSYNFHILHSNARRAYPMYWTWFSRRVLITHWQMLLIYNRFYLTTYMLHSIPFLECHRCWYTNSQRCSLLVQVLIRVNNLTIKWLKLNEWSIQLILSQLSKNECDFFGDEILFKSTSVEIIIQSNVVTHTKSQFYSTFQFIYIYLSVWVSIMTLM